MGHDSHSLDTEGLRFFGKVSAGISHDFKNVLAIINENNGLLEDLVYLAQENAEQIQSDRILEVTAAIQRQVRRADAIVKEMNQFAHSTDEACKQVDLAEQIGHICALAGRNAARKEITLVLDVQPATLYTSPFHLLHLLWRCVDFILGTAKSGTRVDITVVSVKKDPEIDCTIAFRWQPQQLQAVTMAGLFTGVVDTALLAVLGGQCNLTDSDGFLVIECLFKRGTCNPTELNKNL